MKFVARFFKINIALRTASCICVFSFVHNLFIRENSFTTGALVPGRQNIFNNNDTKVLTYDSNYWYESV